MRSRLVPIGVVLWLGTFSALADDDPLKSVREVLDNQVVAWNRHDLDGFCDGYWRSPKLVFLSGGTRSLGWDAMRDRYRKRYQGEGREMGTLVFRDLELETLGPESAFARGRWELTMKDNKKLGGLFTVILRKLPEGWKVVHDHTSADAP